MPFAVLVAAVAAVAYVVRGRRPRTALAALWDPWPIASVLPGILRESGRTIRPAGETTRRPVGIRGWLLLYLVALSAELAHGLMLTVGSLVIYADPALAGLNSFIPLWALLIYVVSNLGLIGYGVFLFVQMLKKRRAAIANNILFNALSVAFLVSWFLLGAKSPFGTVVDSLPGLVAIAYFARSRRVRNTFTVGSTTTR